MTKQIFLLAILPIISTQKSAEENLQTAVNIITEAVDDYNSKVESQGNSSSNSKLNDLSRTIDFTYKSMIQEHMFNVYLKFRNNNNLYMKIYNAKSKDIEKNIIFNEDIMKIEKAPLKELSHRILVKPHSEVKFNMVDELVGQLFKFFTNYPYQIIHKDNYINLLFKSDESTIAFFKISVIEENINDKNFNYNMIINPLINYGLTAKFNTDHTFPMFDSMNTVDLFNQLKGVFEKKCFNNLTDITKIFIGSMQQKGFIRVNTMKVPNQDNSPPQTVVNMQYNKDVLKVVFTYIYDENGVGSYDINIFKVNPNGSESKMELNNKKTSFSRMTINELETFFDNLDIKSLVTLYHQQVLSKFEEGYSSKFKEIYPNFKFTRGEVKEGANQKVKPNSSEREIDANVIVMEDSNKVCEFKFSEKNGDITLIFDMSNSNLSSTINFKVDIYDYDRISSYIDGIVDSHYSYAIAQNK